jgi:uncharacterized protein YcbX
VVPTVAHFNVTPVKSTALQHPDVIIVTELGVEGDHRFLFLNEQGRRLSEAGKAPLLSIQTSFDPWKGVLRAVSSDGDTVEADVSGDGESIEIGLYDRAVTGRVVGASIAEAVSEWAGHRLRLVRVDEPEYAGGEHRLTLVSLASVRDLGRRGGLDGEGPDSRRFRMTVELEDCEPYEEDSWNGSRVRMGDVVVRVGGGVPRCVLTTMNPVTGEKDFPTLEVLASFRRRDGELPFGVYADVVQPGRIRVGDAVEPL